jgi:hypothetical protein
MPRVIEKATRIQAAGNEPKEIAEYVAICLPAFSPTTVHRER